jgi:hypothetical protein
MSVFIFIASMAFQVSLSDTIPAVVPDTVLTEIPADTLITPEPEDVKADTVYIWKFNPNLNSTIADTDSTLRWFNTLNWGDNLSRRAGVVSYRTGTTGRTDGMDIFVYENRHHRLEMDGLILNDPLTNGVNWNRIPIHKIGFIAENDLGPYYRANVHVRDHYVTKPRTYLNFDEGNHNYRGLEFGWTHNLRPGTNLELSFWDRRDGGHMPNNDIEGRQAVARFYHHLSDQFLIRGGYINNALDQGQSFGYNIADMNFYDFNRFNTTAVQPGAQSNQTSSDVYLHLYHRKDVKKPHSSLLGVNYQTDKRRLEFNADSVQTSFRRAELMARHQISAGSLSLQGTTRLYGLGELSETNMSRGSWLGWQTDAELEILLGSLMRIGGYAMFDMRNDDRQSMAVSVELGLLPESAVSLSLFAGYSDTSPDLQALYWQSNLYTGNTDLNNELSLTGGSRLDVRITQALSAGVRAQLRYTGEGIYVNEDQDFVNISSYAMGSAAAWAEWNSNRFEVYTSATFNRFFSDDLLSVNGLLENSGNRLWIKGGFYWKNYVFNNAAFVKAGIHGMFTPVQYNSAGYLPVLNRWQHGTDSQFIPQFQRVDLDVSARVRWMMFLLRWENVLDGVGQSGYFETANYPMQPRRFMLGLRVIFTN